MKEGGYEGGRETKRYGQSESTREEGKRRGR